MGIFIIATALIQRKHDLFTLEISKGPADVQKMHEYLQE